MYEKKMLITKKKSIALWFTLSDGLMDYHHIKTNICSLNSRLWSRHTCLKHCFPTVPGSTQTAHIFDLLLIKQT